ncbi:hypothetical protein H4F99_08345 [Lysobacter sp. SG-8]|uniref:CheB-type methylesterase domain-containing protein n=1 Tax=Marilutibacter penaei TaxID=2759900 RepID=A0A7W3YEQ0_9GAMM|nr:chemotaxis protein CheB [Lysobacter penaei]MBB1088500.1 hypothetical protein [Lysobacter penaei]
MTESSRRVALLVRPGVAADRLRELLAEAGIDNVLQGDPTELDADLLAGSAPQVVLVALDPQTEDALDRFDAVLGNPDVDVIYEEAELAAAREGWEQARWKRHLVAKLQGHDRVLPPRPDGGAEEPAAGLQLQRVAEVSDEAFHAFDPAVDTGFELVEASPVDAQPADEAPALAAEADDDVPEPVADAAGMDWSNLEIVEEPATGLAADTPEPARDGRQDDADDVLDLDFEEADEGLPGLEDVTGDLADDTEDTPSPVFDASVFDPALAEAAEAGQGDAGGFEITYTGDDDGPVARDRDGGLEAHLESLIRASGGDTDASRGDADSGRAEPDAADGAGQEAATDAPKEGSTFGELSLDDGSTTTPATTQAPVDERFGRDLAELDARISGLELVDDSAEREAAIPGAALVLAGIGGPDAVRQFLGALPADFGRPVLVQQRLDGGRYDRLVAQMQRATSLPVHLAEPGKPAMAGFVYMLPAGVGISASKEGMRFQADGDVLSALPPADSAVVLLSGADAADVDQVLKLKAGGALVAGQSAEGCYDAAASDQLRARGGQAGQPVELAQSLAERWPA